MTCDSLKVVDGMSKFTRRSRRSVSLSSSNKTEGRCWCSLIIISLLLSSSRFRYFCFAPPHTFARSLLVFIRSHPLDPTREDQAAKLRTLLAFLLERVKEGPKKTGQKYQVTGRKTMERVGVTQDFVGLSELNSSVREPLLCFHLFATYV